MRRLAVIAAISSLFVLVSAGAALAGLNAGRGRERTAQQQTETAPPERPTLDQQIAQQLARIGRRPDSAEAHTTLGALLLQKARESGDPSLYSRAESALGKSLALDAENADTLVQLGVLAAARHDFQQALDYGQRARVANPYKAAALGVVGDAQVERGRYDEARKTFQAMVDLRPDLASLARVSYMRELSGDLPGAIEAMRRAVIGASGSETHAWTQVQLANLYVLTGDLAAAQHEYERTLFQRPGYLHARAGLARIMAARGDFSGAASIYTEITRSMPLPEYVIALADVQRAAGDTTAAEQTEALVLAMDRLFRENGVNTDVEMALFRADRGIEPAQTVEDARRALALRPSIHAWDALAWALYRTGDYDEALAASDQSLRLGTRDPLMRYHAGMIALALGKTERAREELRVALSGNPAFSVRYAAEAEATLESLERMGSAAAR